MKIQNTITEKLKASLDPSHLYVENESNNHNVPPGSESHFKVTVVSEQFEGKRLIQRHRAVNACLSEELANDIHALAIHTYTAAEWQEQGVSPASPDCMGGSKQG